MSTVFNRSNMGKVWLPEERQQLLERFDRGMTLAEIANAHGRTAVAILGKLMEHRRLMQDRNGFYYRVSPDAWIHYSEAQEAEKGGKA